MRYFRIVLPVPVREEFTYSVREDLHDGEITGKRVEVVFNNRKMTGFAVSETVPEKDMRTSEILSVIDTEPVFSPLMLKFLRWMAEYYICPPGEVFKLALPAILASGTEKKVFFIKTGGGLSENEEAVLRFCEQLGPAGHKEIINIFGPEAAGTVAALRKKGLVETRFSINFKKKEVMLTGFRITGKEPEDGRMKELAALFHDSEIILQKDLKEKNITAARMNKAVLEGFAEKIKVKKSHLDRLMSEEITPLPEIKLNREQEECVRRVKSAMIEKEHAAFLLHGVTGSGKTAVYLELAGTAIEMNGTALVLVPEISLTPQMVRQFRSRFGDTVAVIHSRMSDLERFETWEKLKNGVYRVAVGPRSALFAPLVSLRVIIVDEEHDQSYKQTEKQPRYCAKNSAVMLGYMCGAPVVLGSATPSAESYYNVKAGKYHLLEIKQRAGGASLPPVRIIRKEKHGTIFEKYTVEVFRRELTLGRKIIVLQNRRGYAPVLVCGSCREPAMCPHCSVSLTYHLSSKSLICHYCGYFEKSRSSCLKCGGDNIYFRGAGTEQVEEELKQLFPEVPVYRMDQDSTRNKDGHSSILDSFGKPGPAILTGTKMIAKGLDFHDVSVACVVNIDSELIFPDFRSDERAFQLIEQVAGRAGRGSVCGEVILQTFLDHSGIIDHIREHDYAGFIENELLTRETAYYPPFSRIIKITLSSSDQPALRKAASEFYEALSSKNPGCIIYRPADRMVLKVNNIFRLYILIKSLIINDRSGTKSRKLVSDVLSEHRFPSKIKIDTDVDPVDLM